MKYLLLVLVITLTGCTSLGESVVEYQDNKAGYNAAKTDVLIRALCALPYNELVERYAHDPVAWDGLNQMCFPTINVAPPNETQG